MPCHKEYTCEINTFQTVMDKINCSTEVGQGHKINVTRSNWYYLKGLVTRNTHVKYEGPSNYHSKVMNKINFLSELNQGHKIKVT
jgi:hypothetical protein